MFGPDGRLKLHNASFVRIWDLSAKELAGEPHVRSIAAACAEKFGDAEMWEGLIQAIVSGSAGKRDLGEIERNDRTILSLALSALPDGAILVTFVDVTDRFRIESALRDRNDALEAADRLKSDFIKHVSYELRTPLNTILGFAEHLSSGIPGELNPRQSEYVADIVAGANTLTSLVNDILDLSLIESGALRLELTRIDLRTLLEDVAQHAREWAAKVELDARRRRARPMRASSSPTTGACARSCSTSSPTRSSSRPAAARSRSAAASRARTCRSPSPTPAPASRRK